MYIYSLSLSLSLYISLSLSVHSPSIFSLTLHLLPGMAASKYLNIREIPSTPPPAPPSTQTARAVAVEAGPRVERRRRSAYHLC